MYEPFADDPANRGIPLPLMNPPAKMEALARGADQAQIQICIHAIGDRAIAEILDMYARLGGGNTAAHRFRIEHAQHMRPQDFARFAKLGIVASMQPYHAIDDGRWAEKRLGHERARWSYAWRSMLDGGSPVAFGSDWPVAPLSPILGIYAAVTRATLDGKHPDGWFPEQRLTVEEALRAYTQGSAYAAFQENEKGSIAPRETWRRRGALRRPLHHPPRQDQRCARGHDHRGGQDRLPSRVARTCFVGPRLVPDGQGKAADLQNRSALHLLICNTGRQRRNQNQPLRVLCAS